MTIDYRSLLLDMFQAAVNAATSGLCVPAHLPLRPKARAIVVGAGKARPRWQRPWRLIGTDRSRDW
jgi:glycerate 2-kinase